MGLLNQQHMDWIQMLKKSRRSPPEEVRILQLRDHTGLVIQRAGWWCNNHLEKYEFINGKDDIPYMKW